MIYGLNFNGTQIPAEAKKRFAQNLKRDRHGKLVAVGNDRSCDFMLKGVCNTQQEANAMRVQASNGHRKIHIVERGSWFGVYVS